MDKKFMNKLDDMEMDKVSGGVVPPVYVSRTPPDFKAFEKQDKEKVYPEKETAKIYPD